MTVWIVASGERDEGRDPVSVWSTRKQAEAAANRLMGARFADGPWRETARNAEGVRWEATADVVTVLVYQLDGGMMEPMNRWDKALIVAWIVLAIAIGLVLAWSLKGVR